MFASMMLLDHVTERLHPLLELLDSNTNSVWPWSLEHDYLFHLAG